MAAPRGADCWLLALILCALCGCTNPKITGTIVDGDTGAPVAGADVKIENSAHTARTDASGFFSLPFVEGQAEINVVAQGYFGDEQVLTLTRERYPRGWEGKITLYPVLWVDKANGLMWSRRDLTNNQNMDWEQAVAFCRGLRLGGYSGWRVASTSELMHFIMTNSRCQGKQCADLTSGITIFWSVPAGAGPGVHEQISSSGGWHVEPAGMSSWHKAVCVRDAVPK